jgi:hypothetical protein
VNLSSSEFTFTFRVSIIVSVFVPGRSRTVQKLKKWVCTTRDRPGTKTETIIVTLNVRVNPEGDTLAVIYCASGDDLVKESSPFFSQSLLVFPNCVRLPDCERVDKRRCSQTVRELIRGGVTKRRCCQADKRRCSPLL